MNRRAGIGLGCMRLSTEPDRDEARGIAVLHAAFDAGITLVDTADAYCLDDSERGHNERLIAHARATWSGDRSRIEVATKGGLVRPGGRWEANGRARHLTAAAHDSLRALGVERIDLYQLHAPDPRVPLATSVRALAALQRDGVIDRIGLCNVNVGQIDEARRLADIHSVQIEVSVWHDAHFFSGVVEHCITNGLRVLAYRPLGGTGRRQRTATQPALVAVAKRHDATPFEIALAWLLDLSPLIVPLPGATRVETARSIARAAAIVLTDDDRAQLAAAFPTVRLSAQPKRTAAPTAAAGEVVIVMGIPAAGKSTAAEALVADGYLRLNRDERGGTLRDLVPHLDRALAAGGTRIVLDNTYATRKSRAEVLRAAAARGVPVRCLWLTTSIEDAQINAASRLLARYGRLPDEKEIARLRKTDAAAFLPAAQFRYQRELEPPDASEGFSRIDAVPFLRRRDPSFTSRALIIWCDGVFLKSRSGSRMPLTPDDVDVAGIDALRAYHDAGWRVLGMSWQPEIAGGTQTAAGAQAVFDRIREMLGIPIDVEYCPHAAGPPACWCRKPLPGLAVQFEHRYQLDPAQCIYVGAGPQDPGFARRIGFRYLDAAAFLARPEAGRQ